MGGGGLNYLKHLYLNDYAKFDSKISYIGLMFLYGYHLAYEISTVRTLAIKAKKTHGYNSCIVISVYPLGIPSIKKVQNIVTIDKFTSNLVTHNKSRFKGRTINVLLTNQSSTSKRSEESSCQRGPVTHWYTLEIAL